MTDPGVKDSPVGWVNRHIKAYVESDGEKGHEWRRGVPTLLLTTTGRRTGTKHRTALIYGRDGADYVVVASKGGARTNPAWYLNLSADPQVDVQVGAEKFRAVARTAQGERRARLWAAMSQIWPAYLDYQQKTEREIPVVVITRATDNDSRSA
ncbi:MAG TPA: nitroreductase family deazaflavin-dependent oxidoreductase [Jiangellaceae bacterium]